MANRDLVVRFIGDDRDLQRAFTTSERRATVFQSRMTRLNQSLRGGLAGSGIGARGSLLFGSGAFIGTAAVTAGIKESINAASDLNEQISKSRVVFGEASKEVEAFGKGAASSLGLSERAAVGAAGSIGNMIVSLGLGKPKAAEMSIAMVTLAADMASFNNEDPSAMLERIRSGLAGEVEPLRRFGSSLSAARVEQFAFANSIAKAGDKLTEQQKIMARYGLLLQDTAIQQGDVARTADSLANKQRQAAAETENLAASLGKVLAPAMDIALISTIALVGGINDLITGMGDLRVALRDSDFFAGFNAAIEDANNKANGFFQNLRDNIPLLDQGARLRGRFTEGDDTSPTTQTGPQASRGRAAAARAKREAQEAARETANLTQAQRRARKAFDEFIKGMGLKLDRAGLTKDLDDDLSVMREIERAIQKRIAAEGRTFELAQALTDIQLRIAATIESQQGNAQERETDALEKRIVSQEAADDRRRERLRQRQERRQRNQFEELGLTGEGDKSVPGVGALRKRLGNIRQAVEGTVLDTKQTDQQLDRIAKVLSGKFGKVGREVRDAILQMFNDISGALEQGGKQGPLTKTSGLNTKKILEGLGLSEEETRELRGRLSSFNTAGRAPAGSQNRPTGGGFTGGTGFVIENNVTVAIDGQKFSAVVTKQQQKQKRRNPKQKRGPNRHR